MRGGHTFRPAAAIKYHDYGLIFVEVRDIQAVREQTLEVIIARPYFHRFPINGTLIIKNNHVGQRKRRRIFERMWLT